MTSRDYTRKITYSAMCVALGVVSLLISQFTPARIVPLALASLAVYVGFMRCGWVYGLITALACALIAFFLCGINVTFVFLCGLFLPFAIMCYLLRKLSYNVTWQALVRVIANAVLFCVAFLLIIKLTDFVAGTSIETLVKQVGVAWTVVLITLITLPVDLFFTYAANKIIKMLK